MNGDGLDGSAPDAGAVYVFRQDAAGSWVEEAYIKAANAQTGDEFGYSIALDGDVLAIGARHEDSAAVGIGGDADDNTAVDSGAVYVFERDATGIWSQQAYLKASNTGAFDGFGTVVALHGDTLAVGAHGEDSSATGVNGDQADNAEQDSGAVYIFGRDDAGTWSQQAYLKASNCDAGDQFGMAVSLYEDAIAIGAPNEASKSTGVYSDQNSNSWTGAGAVYVFGRDGSGGWSQDGYIKASNTGNGDRFGASVSLSGNTLVVGAPLEDSAAIGLDGFEGDNKALNSGAAYLFVRDSLGTWRQDAYVKASNTGTQDQFGHAVRLHDDFLAIGATEDSTATGVNGDQADNSSVNSGAVYLMARDELGAWSQVSYLKASNTDSGDGFGRSMAIGNGALVIGAQLEDGASNGVGGDQFDESAADAGAAYLVR